MNQKFSYFLAPNRLINLTIYLTNRLNSYSVNIWDWRAPILKFFELNNEKKIICLGFNAFRYPRALYYKEWLLRELDTVIQVLKRPFKVKVPGKVKFLGAGKNELNGMPHITLSCSVKLKYLETWIGKV